jgi:hypothetical protein
MLRKAVLALGALYLIVALVLLATVKVGPALIAFLLVSGVVIIGSIVFEQQRYRRPVDRTTGTWQDTGERFVDPTTGCMMKVLYNPVTGEREYVETPTRP